MALCQQTSNITYEITGSELVALLLESSEIKKHYPIYNRAQRRANEGYGIFSYEDRSGIIHLGWNNLKYVPNALVKFYNTAESRNFMEKLCDEFELCPKYCQLQTNVSSCFHYHIKKCKGICRNEELAEDYNKRVQRAISYISNDSRSYVITEKGRNKDEQSFVLIENGVYIGYGFMDEFGNEYSLEYYKKSLILQPDNRDVQRIIQGFRNKNEDKFVELG